MNCNATIGAMRGCIVLLSFAAVLAAPALARAAEHPALAQARALYNAADYDGAIVSAASARLDIASSNAAALVAARAYLERYRLRTSDPADLTAAREALGTVRAALLKPRDQIDLLVGLGQALFLGEEFGAAAELFDTALGRVSMLPARDQWLLLDWWASALDREAQRLPVDRRAPLLARVSERMEAELRTDPGNATANYWLSVAAHGVGDVERAWHAAVAAWVRAPLRPESAATLRGDIDRFVTTVLVLDRARSRPVKELPTALAEFRGQWDLVKESWK
jgi:tetratricopeptide (TPR) repeat protein